MNAITRIAPPGVSLRADLWSNGYRPVALCAWNSDPDRSPGKRPVGKLWQVRARQTPPEAAIRTPIASAPNTGLLCDGLRAVDIDIDDPALATAIERLTIQHLGYGPTRSRSNSPRVLIVYRAAEGEPRKITLASEHGKIEVLGYGQQFLAFGMHNTGVEIEWLDGSPLNTARDDLVSVTEDQVATFLAAAAAVLGPSSTISRAADCEPSPIGLQGDGTDIAAAMAVIPGDANDDWPYWTRVGMALHAATDGDGYEAWQAWSSLRPCYDPAATEERWTHWSECSPPTQIGAGTLYYLAIEAVPGWRMSDGSELGALPAEAISRAGALRLVHPMDCTADRFRKYLIKVVLSLGDVGAIVGQPGAGKSILAPHVAYAVAQGRPVFGLRTRQSRILYIAAEDSAGMRQRIHALSLAYGDAPDFAMVEVGNLGEPLELSRLMVTIEDWQPVLVVIDTLAAAWAGIEENASADGMGTVVKASRAIAGEQRAVLWIAHPRKDGEGSVRGHGSADGTLDVSLSLSAKDDDGIIRVKMTKNRNGSSARPIAFKFEAVSLGVDEDGDAITAPRAIEVTGAAAARPAKLTPTEAKALDVLRCLVGSADDIPIDGPITIAEQTWRQACEDGGVSESANHKNLATIVRRACRGLIEHHIVHAADDRVWLPG